MQGIMHKGSFYTEMIMIIHEAIIQLSQEKNHVNDLTILPICFRLLYLAAEIKKIHGHRRAKSWNGHCLKHFQLPNASEFESMDKGDFNELGSRVRNERKKSIKKYDKAKFQRRFHTLKTSFRKGCCYSQCGRENMVVDEQIKY